MEIQALLQAAFQFLGLVLTEAGFLVPGDWMDMQMLLIMHDGFRILGLLVTAAGFFFPCVTTICQINREGSVGQRSSLQYSAGLINCVLWAVYGSTAMGNQYILWVNVFGLGCSLYCLVSFLYHCDQQQFQWGLVCPVAGGFSLVCILALYISDKDRDMNKLFLCWMCALYRGSVALVPLINLGMVRDPRLLAYTHLFPQTGMSLVNSTAWAAFACTGRTTDHFLFWPSLVGMASSLLQVRQLIVLRRKAQLQQPPLAEGVDVPAQDDPLLAQGPAA